MNQLTSRRCFVQQLAVAPLVAGNFAKGRPSPLAKCPAGNLKTSLNAYSFNAPLREGKMSLDDLLVFCSQTGFEAVDITAYYFPGYPEVPPDEFLYDIKRKAFRLGLAISGTGVRNDFTHADKAKRKASIQLVKDWILAAEKLGVPVIRVFAGHEPHPDHSWEAVAEWMIEDLKECVAFSREHGVMIGLQNHNSFVKTADQVKILMKGVDSEWFGLILDTGSFREKNAYEEIAQAIPYAISWQVKEKIHINGREENISLPQLMKIIEHSDYRGYLPIETLGPGDPVRKVRSFYEKYYRALGRIRKS